MEISKDRYRKHRDRRKREIPDRGGNVDRAASIARNDQTWAYAGISRLATESRGSIQSQAEWLSVDQCAPVRNDRQSRAGSESAHHRIIQAIAGSISPTPISPI